MRRAVRALSELEQVLRQAAMHRAQIVRRRDRRREATRLDSRLAMPDHGGRVASRPGGDRGGR